MPVQRRFSSIATACLLLASIAATRFVTRYPHAPGACALLTTEEASAALGVKSLPGNGDAGPTMCVWSNDPNQGYNSPRIMLATHSLRAFQAARHPNIPTIKVEAISGIGDEAFYQLYPDGDTSPFIWARKGSNTFSIRLITIPPKGLTLDQAKARETVLAKAVVSRL